MGPPCSTLMARERRLVGADLLSRPVAVRPLFSPSFRPPLQAVVRPPHRLPLRRAGSSSCRYAGTVLVCAMFVCPSQSRIVCSDTRTRCRSPSTIAREMAQRVGVYGVAQTTWVLVGGMPSILMISVTIGSMVTPAPPAVLTTTGRLIPVSRWQLARQEFAGEPNGTEDVEVCRARALRPTARCYLAGWARTESAGTG